MDFAADVDVPDRSFGDKTLLDLAKFERGVRVEFVARPNAVARSVLFDRLVAEFAADRCFGGEAVG